MVYCKFAKSDWIFALQVIRKIVGIDKEDNVGTLDSEALKACFHVCVIPMKLFFSIRELWIQQISTSTENIYLVKTSVIFYDSTTSWLDRGKANEREFYDI